MKVLFEHSTFSCQANWKDTSWPIGADTTVEKSGRWERGKGKEREKVRRLRVRQGMGREWAVGKARKMERLG